LSGFIFSKSKAKILSIFSKAFKTLVGSYSKGFLL